jgi:membrane fusion protein, multidrug efflux system
LQVKLWGSETSVPATVREVAAAADAVTRTFAVKADVGRAPVRLGQTATVSLAVPPVAGSFKLPLAAVFEQQGKSSVWLLDKATMTVRAQPIVVAGAEEAGQTVVSAGAHTLTPGQKVSLYGAPVLASAASGVAAAR